MVELTLALHRVFDSPRDRILFDTGHQAYVHKMLTGRAGGFDRLRQEGGLSGYPSRAESDHDTIENSHASTALSYADGLAKAYALRGEDRHVVAVVGDGALTGGMAWEALNNIAAGKERRLVVVVNDNGRSYAPTVGGLAERLSGLRTDPRYERALKTVRERLNRIRVVGPPTYEALHAVKRGLKDALAPQGLFEDLGLKHVGPIDGHDLEAVETALTQAKGYLGPVLVHVITEKGHGYDRAVDDAVDQMHQSVPFDLDTGEALVAPPTTWMHIFRDEVAVLAAEREDVVGITAAMLHPTGLDAFADKFPDRVFDVGIAEQHAVTSAAGLALGGHAPGGGDLLDVPQPGVRPGPARRGAARVRGDVRARPCRRDRRGRSVAQRHVGPVDPRHRARHARRRARATVRGCASCCARPSRSTTGRPPCAGPRGR